MSEAYWEYSCDISLFISFSDKPLIKCEGTDSYWNTILYSPEQRVRWKGHSALSLDSPGLCLLSEADHLWMTPQTGVVRKRLPGRPATRYTSSHRASVRVWRGHVILLLYSFLRICRFTSRYYRDIWNITSRSGWQTFVLQLWEFCSDPQPEYHKILLSL